jgi:beta-fructofuranosidase
MKRMTLNISMIATIYLLLLPSAGFSQTLAAHFPMDLTADGLKITETVANKSFQVENARPVRENVAGTVGQALRFDGYSTCVTGQIESQNLSNQAISAELWVAVENYPMMNTDGNNNDYTLIAGNLKTAQSSGFGFILNTRGGFGFSVYIDGTVYACLSPTILPRYEWTHIMATVNVATHKMQLYVNGTKVRITNFAGSAISVGTKPFVIGKSFEDITVGQNKLNTVNGLIDEIKIYSGILPEPSSAQTPENSADLTIPDTRFQDEIQRPIFHGMPAAAWTNEPHGLIYHNGMWHLFFQKNGNGPYWGQIVWGHIVSYDLANWTEVIPALYNDNSYDIKGVWSGCIFQDTNFNNGQPTLFYTGVDFAKASIVTATPNDENLLEWTKQGQIVPRCPDGLSDDFRDPYVFKANGNIYMIVGSSKDGKGCATLHQYNPSNNTWSNTDAIFYQAANADYGTFWEMPAVVEITPGKWLFEVTPLGMSGGTQTLYWVGTINTNGTFNPYTNIPKELELGNMSREGFGLLSPSITQHDGKTIAIGIVPDMMDGYSRGWAHTFSLPREWTLDAQNNLVQKPCSELLSTRSANAFNQQNFTLNGSQSLSPIAGKAVELMGEFKISGNNNQTFGFDVRKNGNTALKIYYQRSNNNIVVDATNIPRIVNDSRRFDGFYTTALPKTFSTGEVIKIHAFIDHSILDIFINDTWAFSVRIFPTDANANEIEVSAVNTEVQRVSAWNLQNNTSTAMVENPIREKQIFYANNRLYFNNISENAQITIYDITGKIFFRQNHFSDNIYLPKNRLYIVRINDNGNSFASKIISY